MAFKLTYTDGQETDYGDDTAWEVDDGVLKIGREEGEWTVLVSPSHWAVIEVGSAKSRDDEDRGEDRDEDGDEDGDEDQDEPKSEDDEKED